MTNNELKLLQSAMDHSKSYLEFGSGNSTYMAVATDNIKKITVVESDVTFWKRTLCLRLPYMKLLRKVGCILIW